ncbi:MAG: hypothetical protein GY719_36740 [bacterium]|nr:hypothetical protein [bacterium]
MQRGILFAGLLLIAASGLYAPWDYTFQAQGISQVVKPAPRAWLFRPPPVEGAASSQTATSGRLSGFLKQQHQADSRLGVVLAVRRLAVEWIVIAAAAGAGVALTHRRKKDRTAD